MWTKHLKIKSNQISLYLYSVSYNQNRSILSIHFTNRKHKRGLSYLVCLCNPLSLLEGSLDNLETSFNFKEENAPKAIVEASKTHQPC